MRAQHVLSYHLIKVPCTGQVCRERGPEYNNVLVSKVRECRNSNESPARVGPGACTNYPDRFNRISDAILNNRNSVEIGGTEEVEQPRISVYP